MKLRRFAVALIVVIAGLLLPAIGQSQSPHPNYQPYQVHEFAPGEESWANSHPDNLTELNDELGLFTATTSETGFELFRSDGTVAGTGLLLDLVPGPAGSGPDTFHVIDGEAWFWAYDPASDSRRLFRTDGTAVGTRMEQVVYDHVQTVREGPLQKFNHRLFFTGVGSQGAELWATNGTSAGTYLVRDINPGAGSSDPQSFVAFGNWLYFAAFDGTTWGVWRTDRMPASTTQVQAGVVMQEPVVSGERLYFRGIDPVTQDCRLWQTDGTTTSIVNEQCPQRMIDVDGTLVFEDRYTQHLYRSDGTAAGTVEIYVPTMHLSDREIKGFVDEPFSENRIFLMNHALISLDIMTGAKQYPSNEYTNGLSSPIVVSEGALYFSFWDNYYEYPTKYIAKYDQNGMILTVFPFYSIQFIVFGDSILTTSGHLHPWVTTTSFAEPQQVILDESMPRSWGGPGAGARWASLNPTGHVAPDGSYALVTDTSRWHVYATDGVSRTEFLAPGDTYIFLGDRLLIADGLRSPPRPYTTTLSFSDGTSAGTETMYIGRIDSNPLIHDNEIYLGRWINGNHEVIRTNGFITGTTTILTSTAKLLPVMSVGDRVIIEKNGSPTSLLSLDPEQGTVETLSPYYRRLAHDPQNPGRFLFFKSTTNCTADGLWSSDGTPAGTYEVADIGCGNLRRLDTVDGVIYFAKLTEETNEFWRTDGTIAGTSMIGALPNDNDTIHAVYSEVYATKDGFFFITLGTSPSEAWWNIRWINRTGSEQRLVTTMEYVNQPQITISYAENKLFISSTGMANVYWTRANEALWAVGTESTTFHRLAEQVAPIPMHHDGQRMYFNGWKHNAPQPSGAASFWVTDGTPAGTVMLTSARADAVLGRTESGALLFFATDHRGTELWVTDGTPAGTRLVADLTPGPRSTRFLPLTITTPWQRYFLADNGVHGLELWRSDGTPAGTERLTDIAPGSLSSFTTATTQGYPAQPFLYANKLLFRANDGINGYELFALPLNSVKPTLRTTMPIQSGHTTATLALTLQNQSFVVTYDPLSVTLSLPPGVTYVSDTSGLTPTVSEGSVTWQAAPLSLGHARTWTITVALPAELAGETLVATVANRDNIPQTASLELVSAQAIYLPTVQR